MVNPNFKNDDKEQKKSLLVKNLFDNIAPIYDLLNNIISLGLHKKWKSFAVDLLEIKETDKVLDLCCGTGDMTQLILVKNYASIDITAVDFSSKMLDQARKRFKNYSNVNIIQADAMNLPFDDDSFDCIIISFGLRNLENIPEGLKEIKRVLRKDGRLVNIDFGKPDSFFLNLLFSIYFGMLIPAYGLLFKKFDEYAYLPSSIKTFPSPAKIVEILESLEYKNSFYKDLFMGFASVQKSYK